uniref:AlNc14C48G3856 protein n=1 Tax=Albugo laibachii Nc14 TaxID=890382 RepID=F0WAZ9_9STRA|nr:AlNc14C48G3856 [Albugo laibachii Nc14]CCA18406.1 AlNc14C50G3934 [Albugo laibachii Nc14]|eukprot:CCA18406.1 AlNc14C50G3934 [Albugo laibachii Nc14]
MTYIDLVHLERDWDKHCPQQLIALFEDAICLLLFIRSLTKNFIAAIIKAIVSNKYEKIPGSKCTETSYNPIS